MSCQSCSDIGVRTRHLRVVRGSTFSFTHVVREDETHRPVDLTGASVFLSIRADIKIDPSVKLTSDDPAPAGWRTGITLADQTVDKGEFTVTIIPSDTINLAAFGHDDPWLYDVIVKMPDGVINRVIAMSEFDLYPQITDLP